LQVTSPFLVRHQAGCHGITFAVGELDNDAKQIPPSIGLSEYVIHRILAFNLASQHQRSAKTSFFNFFGRYAVPDNMVNSLVGPNKLPNSHHSNIPQTPTKDNKIANLE
jgi:hypothetical protein